MKYRKIKMKERSSKTMDWLRRLMFGRYGTDQFSLALTGAYFVFWFLSQLFRSPILRLAALVCIFVAFWRMFSRQLDKRRAENEQFLELIRPLQRSFCTLRCRRRDKEHCYFRCPNCGQQLRVPKGKGKISITCRSCGVSFEEKT